MSRTATGVRPLLACLLLACFDSPSHAQQLEQWRAWNQPVEPFRLAGNLYYVGANDIAAYLIATPEGHILIDGGFVETAAIIRDSVRRLGFRMEDIKILLNTHAHLDHAGGLAQLKAWTGARLLASRADARLLTAGGRGDYLLGDDATYPAVAVDGFLADGDQVTLGGTALTARLTAGHTPGCTSWTFTVEDGGRRRHVVLVCSFSILPGVRLVHEPSYPGIAADFTRTFEVLKSLPCDIFLAPHGSFFDLTGKRERLRLEPGSQPFIDPERYRAYVERGEAVFRQKLAEEAQRAEEAQQAGGPREEPKGR